MKKIFTFIYIFGLVLILASCGSKAGAGEKGEKGADGNGIVSIEKTATEGNVDQLNPISNHIYASLGFKKVFSQGVYSIIEK